MTTVFLDIDGVLNTREFLLQSSVCLYSNTFDRAKGQISPELLKRLHRLVAESNANVVVSSTWRYSWSVADLSALLELHVHGRTAREDLETRGAEITAYGVQAPYVVIDDDLGAGVGHAGRFILVDAATGLTDQNVDDALTILRAA